jgi:sporulation protein YlmC with PRC-barrel domain
MKIFRSILAASALAICFAAPVMAQTYYMTTDHNMRVSKLISTPVYNGHNEKIGQVDDVLLSPTGGEAMAVLSVGDFTGDTKMVKVPVSHVHFKADTMMMPGTKAALVAMPAYTYGLNGGGG